MSETRSEGAGLDASRSQRIPRDARLVAAGAAVLLASAAFAGGSREEPAPAKPLGPVSAPAENPVTEEKRILGKILFFEEQLSSDDSMACATCHVMKRGGTDPRRSRAPGARDSFGDSDDIFGSPGIVALDAEKKADPTGTFVARRQVTSRTAPSMLTAMYSEAVLWDGRAGDRFLDPASATPTAGAVISKGGALESQALLPLTNTVEMGHSERSLAEVVEKLGRVEPLALADRLPADMAAALAGRARYPELFRRAFGDETITPTRIAFAIAAYERTLVPDQTDYDRFIAGDKTALTPQEQRGLAAFTDAGCTACHSGPLFTDGSFRTTGVRPATEDGGVRNVTANADDRGRFKVPSLRNVALKASFFHDGKRTTLEHAVRFYGHAADPVTTPSGVVAYGERPEEVRFVDNLDDAMFDISLNPERVADITAFLAGGLVDHRVQDEVFPFDRPLLASDREELRPDPRSDDDIGIQYGGEIGIATPAFAGNTEFRVDLTYSWWAPHDAVLVAWRAHASTGPVEQIAAIPVEVEWGMDGHGASAVVSLADAQPGELIQFAWWGGDRWRGPDVQITPTASVVVFAPRSKAAWYPRPVPQQRVNDAVAVIESASFAVNWADRTRPSDQLRIAARVSPVGSGTDLSAARLSLRIGETVVVDGLAVDGSGRASSSAAGDITARYDRRTGAVRFSVSDADLAAVFAPTGGGGRGELELDIAVTVSGLGLDTPVAAGRITMPWRGAAGHVARGSYSFRSMGAESGGFHLAKVRAERLLAPGERFGIQGMPRTTSLTADPTYRLRAAGTFDAVGDEPFSAPGGLSLVIGDGDPLPVLATAVRSAAGVVTVRGAGGLRSLRIDTRRRTIAFDGTTIVPVLTAAAPNSTVPVKIRLIAHQNGAFPGRVYETTANIVLD